MGNLLKKKSSRFLSKQDKEQKDEPPKGSACTSQTQQDEEPPRMSSVSTLWPAPQENENVEDNDSGRSVQRDGNVYQPFPRSQSPWTVGRHGLYNLSEPDELPPPLPPAVKGVVYGKTMPVVLPDTQFMQPGEVVPLVDFLREPPPEPPKPPTTRDKLTWKRAQLKALVANPKADPQFAFLPKGANNRINRDKHPLSEKWRRRKVTPKKLEIPAIFQEPKKIPQMPLARPAHTSLLPHRPASPRFCPPIQPAKKFEPGPARDEWGSPFGGEHASFHENPEERAKRIETAESERARRKASDRYLGLQGQRHINDPVIGRPPPLSERILSQPLRLTSAGEKKLEEQLAEKDAKEATPFPKVHFDSKLQIIELRYASQDEPASKLSYPPTELDPSTSVANDILSIERLDQSTRKFSTRSSSIPVLTGNRSLRTLEQSTKKVSAPTSTTPIPRANQPPRTIDPSRRTAAARQPEASQSGQSLRASDRSRRVASAVRSGQSRSDTGQPTSTVTAIIGGRLRKATEPSSQVISALNVAHSLKLNEAASPPFIPSGDKSLKSIDPSKSTEPRKGDTIDPPLPKIGDRYHKWDNALLANKKPVVIVPTPPLPEHSPPPIPRTGLRIPPERLGTPPIQLDRENAFNISGIPSQLKPAKRLIPEWKRVIGDKETASDPKESSDSNSDYSDSLPPEDEQRILEIRQTLTKNSERFARLYQSEVEQAYEDVSRLSREEERFEFVLSEATEGSRSPFDDADDERRRAWDDAQNTLTSRDRLRDSYSSTKLAKCLPHLIERKDKSLVLPDSPRRVGGVESSPRGSGGDTPRRVGEESSRTADGRGPVIGQAISSNEYYPWLPSNQASSSAAHRGEDSHRRARQGPVDTSTITPHRLSQHYRRMHSTRPNNWNDPNWRGPSRQAFAEDEREEKEEEDEARPPLPTKSLLRRQQAGYVQQGPMGTAGFRLNSPVVQPLQQSTRAQATARTRAPAKIVPPANAAPSPPPTINASQPPRQPQQQQYGQTRVFAPLNGPPPQRPLPPLPITPLPSIPTPPRPEPEPKKLTTKKSLVSFLDVSLPVSELHPAKMESKLQVRPSEFSSVKTKAVEDARQMQATVIEVASKAGKDPPKYALLELIGKGSFGRVYKGKDMTSAAIVAIKIIDIDESDTLNPRLANSYSEFLKEVNALKILSESNARNINHVIEALPVGQSMWMITEYCGGGSIATLMKPTAPGGLQEKWIIPILREVAEAIKWVHQAGIIHRDIKCANVLITEQGGLQLCDFGVAGIIENKLDKRSTVIGTPHWMAPELFYATPSYGKEVDIWAFGSMVYEIATGLPPNVANGISFERLGSHLKQHVPRLEGGNYSNDLRNLVAYCLEELPSSRPTIEQVQRHPYIYNTSSKYPASSLSSLVRAFKMWEDHGGSRKSLFMLGGAQGPSGSSTSVADDEWNFSTTAAFDQEVLRKSTPEDVFEAYGDGVALQGFFSEETSRPQKASRRRPPPEALARLPAPLEKIFDPNTMSNYEDNSRNHYGRIIQQPASDLPLRDDTAQTSIRDTMIDLGGHNSDTGLSNFPDMDTIKANRRGLQEEAEDEYTSTLHDFSRPALSDPAEINTNRRTQDWKFPTMAPPASADPELSRFPTSYDLPRPTVTPGSGGPGGRPALVHHPTEPIGAPFAGSLLNAQQTMDRLSMRESLIDLDMSMPDVVPSFARPSTANSDTGSTTSEQMTSGNPFELERHASLYAPLSSESTDIAEPEYYVNEESAVPASLRSNSNVRDIGEISDFSASDAESSQDPSIDGKYDTYSDSDMPPPPLPAQAPFPRPTNQPYTFAHFPELPAPPSEKALSGLATHDEMKDEFNRMLSSMTSQLEAFRDVYSAPQVVQRKGPTPQRRDRKDGGVSGAPLGASNSG